MTDTYCTPEDIAAQVGIDDDDEDDLLASAIAAASRQVEAFCGRRFWQDPAVVVREFYPECSSRLDLLEQPGESLATEISTTTGLIVKTDTGGDGTFATTLTLGTHFLLHPRNAVADGEAFSSLSTVGGAYLPASVYGRAPVQITAKFGWATVPDDVVHATIIQATQIYKTKDAVFGAAALGDSNAMFIRATLNPSAKALLLRRQIVPVG